MTSVIVVLLLHFLLCAFLLILYVFQISAIHISAFPMMILVPVFGPLSILVLSISEHFGSDGKKEIGVEKLRIESEIYQSISFETEHTKEVVPFEEAMILNSSRTRYDLMLDLVSEQVVPVEESLFMNSGEVRRKLMMDILTDDTSHFYTLLEEARLNDDVEVVHYATTAMSELTKRYDLALQKFRELYENDPDKTENLTRYCLCLDKYLSLGLVKGRMEESRRAEYAKLLQKLLERQPSSETCASLCRQLMISGELDEAEKQVTAMEEKWPNEEITFLTRLEYCTHRKDHEGIQAAIASLAGKDIYLSKESREKIRYWTEGEQRNQNESA